MGCNDASFRCHGVLAGFFLGTMPGGGGWLGPATVTGSSLLWLLLRRMGRDL